MQQLACNQLVLSVQISFPGAAFTVLISQFMLPSLLFPVMRSRLAAIVFCCVHAILLLRAQCSLFSALCLVPCGYRVVLLRGWGLGLRGPGLWFYARHVAGNNTVCVERLGSCS